MDLRTANVTRYILPLREGGAHCLLWPKLTMNLSM